MANKSQAAIPWDTAPKELKARIREQGVCLDDPCKDTQCPVHWEDGEEEGVGQGQKQGQGQGQFRHATTLDVVVEVLQTLRALVPSIPAAVYLMLGFLIGAFTI